MCACVWESIESRRKIWLCETHARFSFHISPPPLSSNDDMLTKHRHGVSKQFLHRYHQRRQYYNTLAYTEYSMDVSSIWYKTSRQWSTCATFCAKSSTNALSFSQPLRTFSGCLFLLLLFYFAVRRFFASHPATHERFILLSTPEQIWNIFFSCIGYSSKPPHIIGSVAVIWNSMHEL